MIRPDQCRGVPTLAEGTQTRQAPSRNPLQGLSTQRLIAFGLEWWGVGLAMLIALASALLYVRATTEMRPIFDDSYISLTFARNIAEHGKLSFDGETWSTGATSTLHVVVLAVMLKLGFAPFFSSIAVGVGGMMVLAAGVYMLTWAVFRERLAALFGAIAISFMCYVPLDSGNGLETTLFMAWVAWSAAAYFLSDSPRARIVTGVFIALAVLTRPEGVFLLPAFAVFRWLQRPAGESLRDYVLDCVRLLLPGVIAFAALQVFALVVTGVVGGTGNAKLQFFQEDQQNLDFKVSVAVDQIGLFLGPIIPFVILALLTVTRRASVLLGLFWVPVLIFYTLLFPGGLLHYFFRYQHPILPFLAAFAGGGLYVAVAYAISHRDWAVRGLIAAGLLVLGVYAFNEYRYYRDVYSESSLETLRDLEVMARDLNTIIEPDETLASHDIGAIGYFSDYEIIDLVGLVNPDALDYHNGRRLSEYLDKEQPDYILIFPDWDIYFLHFFAADNPDKFELVKTYPGGFYRIQPYLLYRVNYD
jgi:hypothetical protein